MFSGQAILTCHSYDGLCGFGGFQQRNGIRCEYQGSDPSCQ